MVSCPVKDPQNLTVEAVLKELEVDQKIGLTAEQVLQRKAKYGLNILPSVGTRTALQIFLAQFKNTIVLLLVIATVTSLLFGDLVEALAILAVILLNAIIGFILESQANRSMSALKKLEQPEVKVIRDGTLRYTRIDELVPGDLLSFEAGDLIGADGRLIRQNSLEVNESMLTGESVPVAKHQEVLDGSLSLGDQANMVFRGTSVAKGNGKAVVTLTGQNTAIGHIASLVSQAQTEEIPLNEKLNKFSKTLIWLTGLIMVPFLAIGFWQQKEFYLIVETAIALAVAAIPEGLPIVATIALASGMIKLSARKVLVRKLAAVETLGGTNIILTDKTGTLTENRLEVAETLLSDGSSSDLHKLVEIMVLCNNAVINHERHEIGDPVETALLLWAERNESGSVQQLRSNWSKVDEIPFESGIRRMTTLHSDGRVFQVCAKGATADILSECQYHLDCGEIKELDEVRLKYWLDQTESLSKNGLKVLAGAYKLSEKASLEKNEGLIMTGLVGLLDPARAGVPQAIEECKKAGIKVIMVTGDHPETARSIARNIGLVTEPDAPVVHGQRFDLEENSPGGLPEATIYSRVSPEQKLLLVKHYQSQGCVVAMTGDGVNDAPALKKADIGIAMGLRGTEVAKEAADMVLQDDSFSSIVVAIKQGRTIFNNIRNFVMYLLSCNLSEILVVSVAAFLNLGSPLLPLQILFLNLVTDVFPALALGMGQRAKFSPLEPPRALNEAILTKSHWKSIVVYAVMLTLGVLGAFFYTVRLDAYDMSHANNVAFYTLAITQLIHPFNLIKKEENVWRNGITQNPHLWASIFFCLLLLFIAGKVHPFDELLALQPVTGQMWLAIGLGSVFPLISVHIIKRLGLVG